MTAPTPTTYDRPLPVMFTAPLLNPASNGLFAATQWTEIGEGEASRHLNGVEIRGENYGGENAAGVWDAPWCAVPSLDSAQRKDGDRPEIADPFDPITVWAFDQCDLTAPSRAEVRQRALQTLRLQEQNAVEREFAERLKVDAVGTPGGIASVASLKLAIGYLEGALAQTNTLGFIHVGAQWLSAESGLFSRSGATLKSPMGHTYIVGGGYVEGLAQSVVATSQPYGWRDQPSVREAIDERHNTFIAVAEHTFVVGVEAVVAAVQIVAPEPEVPSP